MSVAAPSITGSDTTTDLLALARMVGDPGAFAQTVNQFVEAKQGAEAAFAELRIGQDAKAAYDAAEALRVQYADQMARCDAEVRALRDAALADAQAIRAAAEQELREAQARAAQIVRDAEVQAEGIVEAAETLKAETEQQVADALAQGQAGAEALAAAARQQAEADAVRAEAGRIRARAEALLDGIRAAVAASQEA